MASQLQNLPWHYEFDASGGYDGLSAAFLIHDSAGNIPVTVDLCDLCDCAGECKREAEHIAAAREIARVICAAVNVPVIANPTS